MQAPKEQGQDPKLSGKNTVAGRISGEPLRRGTKGVTRYGREISQVKGQGLCLSSVLFSLIVTA